MKHYDGDPEDYHWKQLQLIVTSVKDKIGALKDTINLMKTIVLLSSFFWDIGIEY